MRICTYESKDRTVRDHHLRCHTYCPIQLGNITAKLQGVDYWGRAAGASKYRCEFRPPPLIALSAAH
jgi:hypothetical protein